MSELTTSKLWLMRGLFVVIAVVIIFFHLLPLDTRPSSWAGPNLILAGAAAWALRRPDYVPALLLAPIFLLADLLLQRPPGLLALLTLIGCENLKTRGRSLRDASFTVEWITVSIILAAVLIANRIILSLVLIDVPHLSLALSELGLTLLFYPVVVAVTHGLLGVRKAAPGDLDAMGQRI